jgi:rhamnogalacturonyl hydrolase YesR
MDVEGNVVTDVPAGAELFYYVDATRPKQIYFNPGIALIYLSQLYRATGEEEYLEAGQQVFRFTEGCAEDVYRFPPSGKLGFGSALLYSITGVPAARRAALRVAEYLVETQTPEGFWRLPDEELYAAVQDKDGFDTRLDLCSEFTTFLLEIAAMI